MGLMNLRRPFIQSSIETSSYQKWNNRDANIRVGCGDIIEFICNIDKGIVHTFAILSRVGSISYCLLSFDSNQTLRWSEPKSLSTSEASDNYACIDKLFGTLATNVKWRIHLPYKELKQKIFG